MKIKDYSANLCIQFDIMIEIVLIPSRANNTQRMSTLTWFKPNKLENDIQSSLYLNAYFKTCFVIKEDITDNNCTHIIALLWSSLAAIAAQKGTISLLPLSLLDN